jgi:hypothetical protein
MFILTRMKNIKAQIDPPSTTVQFILIIILIVAIAIILMYILKKPIGALTP